jgi:hypothetical protein
MLDSFRCYWNIDHMCRERQFQNLAINEVPKLKLEENFNATHNKHRQHVPVHMCAAPKDYQVKEVNDYRFHIPSRMNKAEGKHSSW